MIKRLDVNDMVREFKDYGREHQFSYEGLQAIFEYQEEVDEDWELDVIALCCIFTEYTLQELFNDYGNCLDHDEYQLEDNQELFECYEAVQDLISMIENKYQLIRVNEDCFIVGC